MPLDLEIQQIPLGQIADSMAEWEGQIADGLGLTVGDVAAIKIEHPRRLKLQL